MKELIYPRFLLPTVERLPQKHAVLDGDFVATYEQHLDRVLRLGDALKNLGVGPGDRFAVMALNGHEFLELYHASLLTGAVINPLNLRLAPKELEFILSDSGCKVCFADGFFGVGIDKVRKEAGVENVVLIGAGDVPHEVAYEDLVASGRPNLPAEPDEDSPGILMYTGGTTGLPKGVVLDQRALMLDVYKVATRWVMNEDYVYLHQTPMFHAASLGGALAIPATGGTTTSVPMFAPDAVIDAIERFSVTMTVMVPTMIAMMLDHASFDAKRIESLKILTYGASPMPAVLLDRLLSTLPDIDIFQGYGMTENCGLLTCLGPEEHRSGGDILRSAGRPMAGSAVSIQDEDGNILPAGETGEVCAQAGNYMREYWNRPEETESAFRGGWYHTGDAGYMDSAGYVFLVDRVKDMIVTGGENVYSAEVENAIASHPAVAQVAVIGIPSEQWGEAVLAIVVPKPDAEVTENEIRAWARERIAGFKVPKEVAFRAEPLPLSGAMKVLKRELRAPYWEGKDRAVQ
ncbi:MAG TPA: long-chain-fatty-acid--CoA ligase [Acidimicrobiales bacterium]|jgi:long-chain acyl-CoA synthetase|nr:long-chain-fatty-acid--CoA ligase [Acidimicrobiales bacterium]